jgi:RNA polymerase sigma-70 factor (ECF subfamily)
MGLVEAEFDRTIVARAADGDEVAFSRIVAKHHDDMARVCYVVCRDIHLAQEAAQNAWPTVWRKLSTMRDPDRLRPWLLAVAANEARQVARRQNRRAVREIPVEDVPHTGLGGSTGDPGERVVELDLRNALARLSLDDRVVLAMSAAGLSSAEIGQIVRMSASGVRARLGRLLQRLREEIGDG